ncbi:MAG: energy transducer TonB [Bacteroidota bacterium]
MSDFKKNSTELKSYIQKLESKEKNQRNSRKFWLLGILGLVVLFMGIGSYFLSSSLRDWEEEYVEPEDIFVDIPLEEMELMEEYHSIPQEVELTIDTFTVDETLLFSESEEEEPEVESEDRVKEEGVDSQIQEEFSRRSRPEEKVSSNKSTLAQNTQRAQDTQRLALPPELPSSGESTPSRGVGSIPLQDPSDLPQEVNISENLENVDSAPEMPRGEVEMEESTSKVARPLVSAQAMPEFPGGKRKLSRYFNRELKYPSAAKDNQVEGSVRVGFIIEPDGSISNPKVIKGLGYGCDEEAVRLIESMPIWSPGMNNGNPVRIFKILSITFALQ